jgi:hypothetical protein
MTWNFVICALPKYNEKEYEMGRAFGMNRREEE